jgi:hypothetical protein
VRLPAVVLAVLATLLVAAPSGGSARERNSLWLLTFHRGIELTMCAVDPATLRCNGRLLHLGTAADDASPEGTRLLAVWRTTNQGLGRTLSLVDLDSVRIVRSLDVPRRLGEVLDLRWLTPTYAVVRAHRVLYGLDLTGKRIRRLGTVPENEGFPQADATASAYISLLHPPVAVASPGAAPRLLVVGRDGQAHVVPLGRMTSVVSGHLRVPGCSARGGTRVLRQPSLVVDRARELAYVVGIDRIAEVDLRTRRVAYHSLGTGRGFRRAWERRAALLPGGVIAVAGAESALARKGDCGKALPLKGVTARLVDTRTWQVRKHPARGTFTVFDDTILEDATGGVRALDLRGRTRYAIPGSSTRSASEYFVVAGKRLYDVKIQTGPDLVSNVQVRDFATGRTLAKRRVEGFLISLECCGQVGNLSWLR